MIISIFNQKGGVGKTTSVVNLSVALVKEGKKVLVIDIDPQANTTTGLGVDKEGDSVYDLFNEILDDKNEKEEELEENKKVRTEDEKRIDFSKYIKETESGVLLINSESSLSGLEVELVNLDPVSRTEVLKEIIGKLEEEYDFVLIDCPPSLGLLSINALVASDSIIIPIQTEYYALEGVSELMNTYKLVKDSLNKDLEIEGVLLTMFDKRTNLSYEVVEEVKSYFKNKVFKTMIPRNVRLAEAPSYGKSVLEYEERSKGATAYKMLAQELIGG
ncbi:Sporulation initiation inhibitor protein soj [Anaerococcus prevotii]|uniref:Sporulation initiation inhibitor protein Soj n=1 Tax=Anaerococcus prevotii (strain ATCC 9321 / DSM 20548 / JCM 6508 / NCTC 11806 / PC1) TaxID=525919 RepID=C7REY3_ANAPD|nr:ParA family protein [Anaerococcus prevotii]ACV29746.1 Cobyrinic acid ac-diamide synthase [Anaerococcus prevotii DSM 20548]SUU95418.1 Sporulation initiation inhibitor protein soj [Anaerococcus prevotii]